jgi:hypothetical protein
MSGDASGVTPTNVVRAPCAVIACIGRIECATGALLCEHAATSAAMTPLITVS